MDENDDDLGWLSLLRRAGSSGSSSSTSPTSSFGFMDFLGNIPTSAPSQGYYDEITGQFIPTTGIGFPVLNESSGTSPQFDANWAYDPKKQTWTDAQGKSYDMSYLSSPAGASILKSLQDALKRGLGGSGGIVDKGIDLATSKGGIAAIMAALAALDRQKPSGGGTKLAYQGPRQYTRTVAPGATGTPIARYAAEGGLMQAYAQGGHVQMEDGGFVMTKRAVDGAGGPRGIQQLVPGARLIRGPGTGTSDSIPATIQGRNGSTPAKVSNGEAYVPRAAVQQAGGPKRMYALMNSLQRKA